MIIDGKLVAREVLSDVRSLLAGLPEMPTLAIVAIGHNPVIESFIRIKQRTGKKLGVQVKIFRFEETVSQEEVFKEMQKICTDRAHHGVILQLPIPSHLSSQELLNLIPAGKDVDVLSENAVDEFATGSTEFFPPVAGAVREILLRHQVSLARKKVVVLGRGRLVGSPIIAWLTREGIHPVVCDIHTPDISVCTSDADVIITGTGRGGLITPEIIKQGVVLIDAGTSEEAGVIRGDCDPRCADKASLMTTVPGGVGPVTVAILMRNVVLAAQAR